MSLFGGAQGGYYCHMHNQYQCWCLQQAMNAQQAMGMQQLYDDFQGRARQSITTISTTSTGNTADITCAIGIAHIPKPNKKLLLLGAKI